MDSSALTDLAAYSNIGTLIGIVGLTVWKCLKHSKCRSRCCGGNETSISVDLEESLTPKTQTTPPPTT